MYDPYPQQTPPPYPYAPQPQPPRSRAPFVLLGCAGFAVIVVVMLGIIGALAGGGDPKQPAAKSAPTSAQAKVPPKVKVSKAALAAPGIGDTVKDGGLSFTVTKFKQGPKRIGNQYLGATAQGRFWLVYVTVKNHGDDPAYFTSSGQNLLAGNKQYAADATAAAYIKDSASLFTSINPGNEVDGIIVFDVPKSVKPTAIELHDSTFSRGVKVAL